MQFIDTDIEGLKIIEPKIWADDRGYFYESFNEKVWKENMPEIQFIQDNQAKSSRGVLRGLHYQAGVAAQSKLVRVIHGEVLDVVVDVRKNSATYGKWFSIRLSAANHKQLFVPRGFAHGYLTLSQIAIFVYKCDNFYSKSDERGIKYDDPSLNIDWEYNLNNVVVSEKDLELPSFGHHE